MAGDANDVAIRILLSIDSSDSSIEDLQSIHSISSISEGSLELSPQSGSIRVQQQSTSKYAASQQKMPSTYLYTSAMDNDEDAISRNSSHFSLGLNPSERLKGPHRHGQFLNDNTSIPESSQGGESTEDHSSTMSLESSDNDMDGHSDHMELAALLAKAKGGNNQAFSVQQASYVQSKGMIDFSGTLLDKSSLKQMSSTKPTIVSPSSDESSTAEPLETKEPQLRVPPSIQKQSFESRHTQGESKQATPAKVDGMETGDKQPLSSIPTQRLSQHSLIPESSSPVRHSFQSQNQLFESNQKDSKSCGSQRKNNQSISQEQEHREDLDLLSMGRKEQEEAQAKDGNRQPCESPRKSNPTANVEADKDRVESSAARERKSKQPQTGYLDTFFSGSQKNFAPKGEKKEIDFGGWTEKKTSRVSERDFHPRKAQQTTRDRFSWEGYQRSRIRNERKDDFRRRSWAYEETESKRFTSRKGTMTSAKKPKATMKEEAKDRRSSYNRKLSVSEVVNKRYDATPPQEEKKKVRSEKIPKATMQIEVKGRSSVYNRNISAPQVTKKSNEVKVPQEANESQEAERHEKDDSMLYSYIPKADCRPISEKLKDIVRIRRQSITDSRISYHSPQLSTRMMPKNDNSKWMQRDCKLESRQDSFGGEREMQAEHNQLPELSILTSKCRTLSDKEHLMRVYQEKEKLANEFIDKWSKLSGKTAGGSYMRQNHQYTPEIHNRYNYEQRLPIRNPEVSPWSRISSLTHELPHPSTVALQAKTRLSHRQRQLGTKKKRWVCDICGVVNFESYAACYIHEKNCTGPVRNRIIENPPKGRSWLLSE
ncbi:MAG: hypothetical protein SGBAC_008456 [Bacillariaceae sp.]